MVYLYTTELFPTSIRSTAIGACSTIARIGGIVALLMQGISYVWPPLTMLIFGLMAIIGGILAAHFPETINDKLPQNMDESLNLGQNVKRNRFGIIQSS